MNGNYIYMLTMSRELQNALMYWSCHPPFDLYTGHLDTVKICIFVLLSFDVGILRNDLYLPACWKCRSINCSNMHWIKSRKYKFFKSFILDYNLHIHFWKKKIQVSDVVVIIAVNVSHFHFFSKETLVYFNQTWLKASFGWRRFQFIQMKGIYNFIIKNGENVET